jgi:hypothetical protein
MNVFRNINEKLKNSRLKDFSLVRRIDKWLRSIPMQALALTVVCIGTILILCLSGYLLKGESDTLNWLLAFMNPGCTEGTSPFDRIFALVIGFFGITLLNGLLISVLNNILQRRIDNVNEGKVFYKFSGHIIVIGYNSMVVSIIRQVNRKHPNSKIVLLTVQKAPDVRHELFSNLPTAIEERVTIVNGNRNSKEILEKLHPELCHEIFLLGETGEYDHDSENIKCLELIRDILKPHIDKLLKSIDDKMNESNDGIDELKKQRTEIGKRCHVLFEYQSTYAVFQQQEILDIKGYIDFIPFNFHECWAQKVLIDGKYEGGQQRTVNYSPLDGAGITAISDKHVHLVIIGMSRMGIAMGIQAAHLCHFPNFVTKGIKSRITFIDENADREMNFLKGHYLHLFAEIDYSYTDIEKPEHNKTIADNRQEGKEIFTDIELEFIKGRPGNPAIQKLIAEWAVETDKLLTVAVCLSHSPVAIAAGLYLPDEIYTNRIPVFVRQEASSCILSLLSQDSDSENYYKYSNVKPFGMLDDACDLEKADDLLPMRVHYIYDYFFSDKTYGKLPEKIPVSDMKTKWQGIPIALKWSNRFNINMLAIKERSFTLTPDSYRLDLLAEVEHNRWNIEKLLMGYRPVTAEERETKNKEELKKLKNQYFAHTDICAYSRLPESQKEIDRILSKALPLIKNPEENEEK